MPRSKAKSALKRPAASAASSIVAAVYAHDAAPTAASSSSSSAIVPLARDQSNLQLVARKRKSFMQRVTKTVRKDCNALVKQFTGGSVERFDFKTLKPRYLTLRQESATMPRSSTTTTPLEKLHIKLVQKQSLRTKTCLAEITGTRRQMHEEHTCELAALTHLEHITVRQATEGFGARREKRLRTARIDGNEEDETPMVFNSPLSRPLFWAAFGVHRYSRLSTATKKMLFFCGLLCSGFE